MKSSKVPSQEPLDAPLCSANLSENIPVSSAKKKRKTKKSGIDAAVIFGMTNEHRVLTYPNLLTMKTDLFQLYID